MADFNKAIQVVLAHEGSYVDNPIDRGGPTNRGITMAILSAYRGHDVSVNDMKDLTIEETLSIYKSLYWEKMHLDEIHDQVLATIMMDLGVLRGPSHVVLLLQRLLLDVGEDDGVCGPRTVIQINEGTTFKGFPVRSLSLWVIADAMEDFYRDTIKNPSQKAFLPGWVNRANSLTEFAIKNGA